jgi:hypothetical protein
MLRAPATRETSRVVGSLGKPASRSFSRLGLLVVGAVTGLTLVSPVDIALCRLPSSSVEAQRLSARFFRRHGSSGLSISSVFGLENGDCSIEGSDRSGSPAAGV